MKNNAQVAISAISEMPQTKAELDNYCDLVKSYAMDGEFNMIEVAEKINIMGRIVDFFEKDSDIQELLINEVEKYHKSELPNFQTKEVGVKYFFDECGHAEYNRLIAEKKELDDKIKAIETQLKAGDINGIDILTGEVFEAKKACKSSKTKVVITFKK
jgi:hypothetical protein